MVGEQAVLGCRASGGAHTLPATWLSSEGVWLRRISCCDAASATTPVALLLLGGSVWEQGPEGQQRGLLGTAVCPVPRGLLWAVEGWFSGATWIWACVGW